MATDQKTMTVRAIRTVYDIFSIFLIFGERENFIVLDDLIHYDQILTQIPKQWFNSNYGGANLGIFFPLVFQ